MVGSFSARPSPTQFMVSLSRPCVPTDRTLCCQVGGTPCVHPCEGSFPAGVGGGVVLRVLFQATPGCELHGQWSPWETHHPGEAGRCWTATSACGAALLGRLLSWSKFTGGPGGWDHCHYHGDAVSSFLSSWGGGGMSRGPTEAPCVSFYKAWIYFIPLNVSVFGKILWKREWQPTPVFLPGDSHRQRSLVGYSPWGHKGVDTTEHRQYVEMILSGFPPWDCFLASQSYS